MAGGLYMSASCFWDVSLSATFRFSPTRRIVGLELWASVLFCCVGLARVYLPGFQELWRFDAVGSAGFGSSGGSCPAWAAGFWPGSKVNAEMISFP